MTKKMLNMLVLLLTALFLTGCGAKEIFVTNSVNTKTDMPVYAGLDAYSGENNGVSFLYPEECEIIYSDSDGAGIYSNGYGNLPYVLVKKTDKKGMTPQKYFDASNKQLLKAFKQVNSTPILETVIDDKTLYMTRYVCSDGNGGNVVVDRYVELYDDFYIQYSSLSAGEGDNDTATYYAIKTASTMKGAYNEGIATSLSPYSQSDTGISISLPDLYKVNELTIGYMVSGSDVIMLCIKCDTDGNGNPITSRNDFVAHAMNDSTFMASYLGAESVTFGSGSSETINGRDYYVYPMTMETYNGTAYDTYSGKIYLGDSSQGCMVICYGISENNTDNAKIAELFESSVKTLKY